MRLRLLLVALCMSACPPADSTCAEGTQRCEDACVDLSSSTANCGACGTACAAAQRCVEGACVSGCTVSGNFVGDGATNPDNPCERCAAATSTTSWTARADGSDCGNAQVCQGGACGAGCFIDGVSRATGELNPQDPCEACAPGTSTSAWSPRGDGAACGAGQVCGGGACASQCFIDGALVGDGVVHGACEQCAPAQSTTGWSPRADGTACGAGRLCAAGACTGSCFIAQQLVDAGALNPQNACEQCEPASDTTGWSARGDGASCTDGVCEAASCVDKCFIGGGFVDAGVLDAANLCRACRPAVSTSDYATQSISPLLTPGTDVAAQGWSVVGSGPRSLVDDGGVIVLSTGPNGTTSGYQLLTRRLSPDGGAFTLRVELRVDAVNAHNALDSAAAILGSFTPPFGLTVERSQLAYLDAVNVGWGDDTQSAAVGNLDGGFHVYELAVDADGGATFSVDGVARLARGDFTTNGIIAIGDQTNDANVDSTLSLRAVSLVCQ